MNITEMNNQEFVEYFNNLNDFQQLYFLKHIFDILDKQQCAYLLGLLLALIQCKED